MTSIRQELAALVTEGALLPEGGPLGWPMDVPAPGVQVAPGSEEEVARVLERASQEGWRVLPSGGGSQLGGAGAKDVDILLSTRRLGGVSFYEPADLTFSAGAGLPFRDLQETTGSHGQWVPLDPPGWEDRSLGGVVASGAAGPLRHAYGSPRDHVLGLTLVTGDGRILRWGGRVVKNVAGFDVTRLCIGSRGALGVITSVSARLFPLPDEDVTLLLTGRTMEELLPVARTLINSPLPFATAELVDPVDEGGGAGLALRFLGTRPQVEEMESRGRDLVMDWMGEGRGMETLYGEESKSFFGGFSSWESGAELVVRLALLPSKADALVARGRKLGREISEIQGGEVRMTLNLSGGVLRVASFGSGVGRGGVESLVGVFSDLREEMEGEGGSLVLSRGPAALVQEVGAWGRMGGESSLVHGLKKEFDPQGILPLGGWQP